jgi:hypothetical protein
MDPADILSTVEIGIPLYLVISYVGIISLCLLLARIQLGLAVSFLFVFYLGYFYNRQLILDTVKGSTLGTVTYTVLGFVIIILAIISFFSSPKQRR